MDNVCGKVKDVSKFYKLVTAAKKPMDTSVQWELAKLAKGDALTTEQAKAIFEQVKETGQKLTVFLKSRNCNFGSSGWHNNLYYGESGNGNGQSASEQRNAGFRSL